MSKLFTPIKVGDLTIKNRFVRSATQDWWGNPDGSISEKQIELYEALAEGGTGLIMSAHSYVQHPKGRASLNQNGIYDDRFIPGFKGLADIVHKHGGVFIVQVSHAGPQTTPQFVEGQTPFEPDMMTEDEILNLIDDFAKAIYRVKMANCDGAQIHLAHGYLLARFLSPDTNKRQDKWGGSLENRMRIVVEIINKARGLAGDFPLLAKLNSEGGFEGTAAISIEDVVEISKTLESLGICAIEISGGVTSEKLNSLSRTGISSPDKEAYFENAAVEIKKSVNIPIILVGGLRSRVVMDRIIDQGSADMISLCRPFVREPDLVRKIEKGQEKVTCVSCNLCRDFTGLKCNYRG